MGKRCEFSSRTVITIDTNIAVDEIGVPFEIARGMTIPVLVNESNVQDCVELVKSGPRKYAFLTIDYNHKRYPGANYIRNPQVRSHSLWLVSPSRASCSTSTREHLTGGE